MIVATVMATVIVSLHIFKRYFSQYRTIRVIRPNPLINNIIFIMTCTFLVLNKFHFIFTSNQKKLFFW